MRIDYLGLEAFVAIAEHGSFQRAAEALSLSQTALSHRLRKLEAELGAPVLTRSSREVSLTEAGQDLLPDARRLLKALGDSYAAVRARARQRRRQVAFACLPTVAHTRMPPVLARFAADLPDVTVTMHDIPAHRIAELVLSGAAEFGVTIVSAQLPDLRVRALFDEPYELLVPEGHPLSLRASVPRAALEGVAMARIATQFQNRQLVDAALGPVRDRIEWRFVMQNASMAMAMVAAGAALTILPRSAGDYAPPGVVRRPFADIRMARSVGVVTRRGVPLSDLGQRLLGAVAEGLGCAADLARPMPRD
jgi:DNA-binding transcriptional LysR family regulator